MSWRVWTAQRTRIHSTPVGRQLRRRTITVARLRFERPHDYTRIRGCWCRESSPRSLPDHLPLPIQVPHPIACMNLFAIEFVVRRKRLGEPANRFERILTPAAARDFKRMFPGHLDLDPKRLG